MTSKKTPKTVVIENIITEKDLRYPFRGVVNINLDHLLREIKVKLYDQVVVYDSPKYLPYWYGALSKLGFNFKYHVVVYFEPESGFISPSKDKVAPLGNEALPVSHTGLLIFTRDGLKINKVRVPHRYCKYCGRTVKDWGGKAHLMHPEGSLISDVWKHLNLTYNDIIRKGIPDPVKNILKKMFGESITVTQGKREIIEKSINAFSVSETINQAPLPFINRVFAEDALEFLKKIPANSVDMIFVDPPYNLGKQYKTYKDERDDYVEWTIKWLNECMRVLKPGGSFFYLNIPRWAHEILNEVRDKFYLQRWIVWDNQAEPRGKLIPAHYALLWLSKTPKVKAFPLTDYEDWQDSMDYCLRQSCVRKRRAEGIQDRIPVRDVRWDIHRVKHRKKRYKGHPAQLPERLLEFLIKLTTEPGDIVMDPMMGTGTTVVVAQKLGRKFIGIDIDPYYVEITKKRLEGKDFEIIDLPEEKSSPQKYSKKEVQLKLGELAVELGRLPTLKEGLEYLGMSKEELFRLFPTWGKALKYAKLRLSDIERNRIK